MGQLGMFDDDEPEPPVDVVAPSPIAGQGVKLTKEQKAVVMARADATLAAHADQVETLRRGAAAYFGEVTKGKTYTRSPGLKITVVDRAVGLDDFEHRLAIAPSMANRNGQHEIIPGAAVAFLYRVVPDKKNGGYKPACRLAVRLSDHETPASGGVVIGKAWIGLHYPADVDVDALRLCKIITRFVADPSAAIAESGTHCSFCGRSLTDPVSRRRGIGPECFDKMGDFLRYLVVLDPETAVY